MRFWRSRKRRDRQADLIEAMALMGSTLDRREIFRLLVSLAAKLLRAQAPSIFLLDRVRNELVFVASTDVEFEEGMAARVPVGRGIAGWVAQYGEPLNIPDVTQDKRFSEELDKRTGSVTRSLLCVPMVVKGKIIGVVQVLNRVDGKPFSQEDERILVGLASQAAVAIENAQLYEQLKRFFATELDAARLKTHIPMFSELQEEAIRDIVEVGDPTFVEEGTLIYRQGDMDQTFYILLSGSVSLSYTSDSDETILLETLERGDFFGELEIWAETARTTTAQSLAPSSVLEIRREAFLDLIAQYAAVAKKIDERHLMRSTRLYLSQTPLFEGFGYEDMERIIERARPETYERGQAIVVEGEPGDSFYLLRSGTAKVYKSKNGSEQILAYLRAGQYFGETALLEDICRTATVAAMTKVDVVRITSEDFMACLDRNPELAREIREVSERRLAKDAQIAQQHPLTSQMINFVLEQGASTGVDMLIVDLDKCTECGLCEKACEMVHGQSRLLRKGQRLGNLLIPASCVQCQDPECLLACRWDCIRRLPSGQIEIDEAGCKGCGQCVSKCPWGNILLVEEMEASSKAKRRKAVMCDMCQGLPYALCTYNCSQGAAQRGDPRELFPEVFEAIELQ